MTAYSVPETHTFKAHNLILQKLDGTSTTANHDEGFEVENEAGKKFRYQFYQSSGVAALAGSPLVNLGSASSNQYIVTSDTSDASAEGSFAGVATVDQSNGNNVYIWGQTKGIVDGAAVKADVSANDVLYVGQAQVFEAINNTFDSTGEAILTAIGVALTAAADASGDASTAQVLLY